MLKVHTLVILPRMAVSRLEQYHTHAYIVNGYKVLPMSLPMGIKHYPYSYPMVPLPVGYAKGYQIVHKFTI
jgi:hypothetical protein